MIIGVVYSVRDPAGIGMARVLAELFGKEFVLGEKIALDKNLFMKGFDAETIEFEFLYEKVPADAYVVLSKHRSESGKPCFTVHPTGNPTSRAELGGEPLKLSVSFPRLAGITLYNIYEEASKAGVKEIDISYEVTHHGPTGVPKPLVFVEIGSTPREWVVQEYHRVLGVSVYNSLKSLLSGEYKSTPRAVGFGGGHYARRFTSITLNKEAFFGHMLAKYALREEFNPSVIRQAIEKNFEEVNIAYMERKCCRSSERNEIKRLCSEYGIDVVVI